jgi:hypothetical protein
MIGIARYRCHHWCLAHAFLFAGVSELLQVPNYARCSAKTEFALRDQKCCCFHIHIFAGVEVLRIVCYWEFPAQGLTGCDVCGVPTSRLF